MSLALFRLYVSCCSCMCVSDMHAVRDKFLSPFLRQNFNDFRHRMILLMASNYRIAVAQLCPRVVSVRVPAPFDNASTSCVECHRTRGCGDALLHVTSPLFPVRLRRGVITHVRMFSEELRSKYCQQHATETFCSLWPRSVVDEEEKSSVL